MRSAVWRRIRTRFSRHLAAVLALRGVDVRAIGAAASGWRSTACAAPVGRDAGAARAPRVPSARSTPERTDCFPVRPSRCGNLKALGALVRRKKAISGSQSTGRRWLAIVDEKGRPIGEDYTARICQFRASWGRRTGTGDG